MSLVAAISSCGAFCDVYSKINRLVNDTERLSIEFFLKVRIAWVIRLTRDLSTAKCVI